MMRRETHVYVFSVINSHTRYAVMCVVRQANGQTDVKSLRQIWVKYWGAPFVVMFDDRFFKVIVDIGLVQNCGQRLLVFHLTCIVQMGLVKDLPKL